MRRAAVIALAALFPLSAVAQGVPMGWSTILGKTCNIRLAQRGLAEAKFIQDDNGPSVQLRQATTKITRVTFIPPSGIAFDLVFDQGSFRFTYDDKTKTWSGVFGGQPAYLVCPR
jgi:hypothetical protein